MSQDWAETDKILNMTSCYSSFQVVIVMHSQIIKLKFRSLAIGLLLFTAVKYLFLMPNSPYSTKPLQIVDTNEEELIEDIIVQNDQTTNEILHTFAQRRDHVRNICQKNKIENKFPKSWKSFKQSLRDENNFSRSGQLLSKNRWHCIDTIYWYNIIYCYWLVLNILIFQAPISGEGHPSEPGSEALLLSAGQE